MCALKFSLSACTTPGNGNKRKEGEKKEFFENVILTIH